MSKNAVAHEISDDKVAESFEKSDCHDLVVDYEIRQVEAWMI